MGKLVTVLSPITEGKGIDWSIDIDSRVAVQADPADVAEAIGNILDNAVRFARRRIQVSAVAEGQMVTVRVGDDGPGVDAEYYARMLKRGVTDADAGHGLGLAISSDIAAAYGGELRFRQSHLGGLEANLSLPALRCEAPGQ
ncbi:ATP-binding protein [Sinorhizobium sp. BG8]|uniref:ATP-binding protein n=1 Tax=Sinorhizobium sp. BG8 TaxID=2613773 RepID=UPI00193CC6E1|nr:ATP-binding protein [Sinorhizobium sp. BG8]QRM54962.1 GHKL domain-containing protein [Sinorhizobium sp. BG8]